MKEKIKCANCEKTDYTEGIDFDGDVSFCRECCEKEGMPRELKAIAFDPETEIYQDYETLKKMAREEVIKEIKQNIGLLRQFINEKSDGTLMTNQMIENILGINK